MKSLGTILCAIAILAVAVYRKLNPNSDAGNTTVTQVTPSQPDNTKYIVLYKGTGMDEEGVSNAISEILEYGLPEAETIAKQKTGIICICATEAESKDVVDSFDNWELKTEYIPVSGVSNISLRNMFRVDNVFALPGRGVVATGIGFAGTIRKGEQVCIIRQDGTTQNTTVTGVEIFRSMLDETRAGQNCGLGVDIVSKEQIKKGDVIVTFN